MPCYTSSLVSAIRWIAKYVFHMPTPLFYVLQKYFLYESSKLFGYLLSDKISRLCRDTSVRFEVLTAVTMVSTIFGNVMSCNLVEVY
jgi:hypothetical protein